MSSYKKRIFYSLLAFFSFFNQGTQASGNAEKELQKFLDKKRFWYFQVVEPGSSLPVQIELFTFHGAMLDVAQELLTINGYVKMNWRNPEWSWNASDFQGIDKTFISSLHIWTPKISLINSFDLSDFREISSLLPAKILVRNDGYVFWRLLVHLRVKCPVNLRNFPFDHHYCPVTFSTAIYEGTTNISLNLHNEKASRQLKQSNQFIDDPNDWIVYQLAPIQIDNSVYFNFHFTRRTSYYAIAVFIPLLASTVAAASVFWLPHSGIMKFTVGGIGIFIQVILLTHLRWLAPSSSASIPIIVLVSCFQLVLSVSYLLLSGMIFFLLSRQPHYIPLPEWIVTCLYGPCGKILLIRVLNKKANVLAHYTSSQDEVIFEEQDKVDACDKNFNHNKEHWFLFCTAIDRMLFIFYCCSYLAIIISSSY